MRRNLGKLGATQLFLAELKSENITAPKLEYRFHPVRKWRFDAAWPEHKVAVEIHGATYAHGHHVRGAGFADDREKMNEAQLMGWTVLEYDTKQVYNGVPIDDLKRAFA